MRRLCRGLTVCCLGVLLASCGAKQAGQYAEKLSGLLDVYRQEVNKKIEDETRRHQRAALRYAAERREDTLDRLTMDRREAAVQFRDQLLAGGDAAGVLNAVQRIAATDFEITSKTYLAPSDDYNQHIANLEELKFEQARVDKLQKILADLAGRPDFASLAADVGAFGKEFQNEHAQAQCLLALDRLKIHAARTKTLETQIAALAAGNPLRKAKEAELESVKADITSLEAARDSSGRFENGACVA